ncbi:MAG: LCP family protein [Oscillospiraceae bacterium]|nr:LCP family protein [Oscillospiraceae bacterium]
MIILLIVLIGGGLLGLYLWEQAGLKQYALWAAGRDDPLAERLKIYYNGAWYALRDDLDTCLIIGVDKNSERLDTLDEKDLLNNLQSDFLLLLISDRSNNSYTTLQINRDTMAEIPRIGENGRELSPVTQQLALAHTYGSGGKDSCRNTVKAVSRLLYDVPIDHYYAITMDAVPVLNDLVDGVKVHIDDDLTAADPAFVQGTDVTLHGDQALRFVRARMSVTDGTNLSRMNRQRVYLDALYSKLKSYLQKDGTFALKMADSLADYSTSDLIPEELARFAEQLKNQENKGIETMQGEARMGARYVEFYPNEDLLQASVIRLFFEPMI